MRAKAQIIMMMEKIRRCLRLDILVAYYNRMKYSRGFRKINRTKVLVWLAWGVLVALIGGLLGGVALFAYFAKDLPSPDKVVRREGFATKIYDRNGQLLYDVYADQKRTPVELAEIPVYLRQATLAIEDKNFYKHDGFDIFGIFRGAFRSIFWGRLQSGSTLTQQLVKNTLLSTEQTLPRKIKELVLTLQVERKYSKDQILQMYLNEAPYGGTAWGVESAAETFFGKPVGEITMAEAVILAGLPQSPSYYSPFKGKAYVDRAYSVLRRMREDGYITLEQEKQLTKEILELEIQQQSGTLKAPHFVFYVKDQLIKKYGEKIVEEGGLKVTTTLDLEVQSQAETVVAEEIKKVEYLKITNGAAMAMDTKTGQILAMVGSKGWADPDYDGKYNVTTALRQPGSSIKPVTYLAGLRKGYTAATLLMDTKTVFPSGDGKDYVPVNYDGKYRGPILVRQALANSLNVPAVKMVAMVGIKDMLQIAFDMGFTTLKPTDEFLKRVGLSVTLGGGEVKLVDMVAAYSAFANGGKKVEPVAILKVVDQEGNTLEDWRESDSYQVMSPGEAFIISSILSDPAARQITFGAATSLAIPGRTAAVKTGTTNDRKDNWAVGWTAEGPIVGVWVGNNDNTSMREVASGITGASPIWKRIMIEAVKKYGVSEFKIPEEVIEREVDIITGYGAHDGFPSYKEYFIKGTEPGTDDPIHKNIQVCKGEGKLATPADIGGNNFELREAFYFKEEDPFQSDKWSNKWQEGILEWLSSQADPKYHPPTDYCGSGNSVWITVKQPNDRSRIDSSDVKVVVEVAGTAPINKVEFFIDGQLKYSLSSSPWEITIPNVSNGIHKIEIKAFDDKGFSGSRNLEIGVNQDWASPTPTSTPIPTPTPTE